MANTNQLFSFLACILLSGCQSVSHYSCDVDQFLIKPTNQSSTNSLKQGYLQGFDAVPRRNNEREEAAYLLLREAGCQPNRQAVNGSREANVLCRIGDLSAPIIVVAAHFDRTGKGDGIVDNWSGVTMIAALAEHFQKYPPQQQMLFAALAEEENDLAGSRSLLNSLNKNNVTSMVNIDTIAMRPLYVDNRSTDKLICLHEIVSRNNNYPFAQSNLREISGDWEIFRRAGIPVINFHSMERKDLRLVHTSRDRLDQLDLEQFKQDYLYLLSYLESLDGNI